MIIRHQDVVNYPEFDRNKYAVWARPNPLLVPWVVNPGLAFLEALLEYETLDGKHIGDTMEHGRMLTPPPAPLLPPSNPTLKEPLPVNPPVKAKEDDGGLLPGLPAPA